MRKAVAFVRALCGEQIIYMYASKFTFIMSSSLFMHTKTVNIDAWTYHNITQH